MMTIPHQKGGAESAALLRLPVIPGLTRDPQNFVNIKGIAGWSPQ